MSGAYVAVDDELGVVRFCESCSEWWPADGEFYADDRPVCRACEYDRRRPFALDGPSRDRRLEQMRAFSRSWRDRQRFAS